jgi:Ser/Thr protein kinase RdoA (MazF antagonist)
MSYIRTRLLEPAKQLEAIAGVIARMHRSLAEISHDRIRAPLAVESKRLKRILRENRFEALFPYLDEAENIKRNIRWQLVHNDLHPGNIISSVTGKIYLLDFESFSANPLVADVLFAAFRLVGGFSRNFFRFLKMYDMFNPLDEIEKQKGLVLLAADFIRKLGFIMAEQEKGNEYYMKDYAKYQSYIHQTLEVIDKGKSPKTTMAL